MKKPEVNGKNVKIKTALKAEIMVEKFLPEVWFNYKTVSLANGTVKSAQQLGELRSRCVAYGENY